MEKQKSKALPLQSPQQTVGNPKAIPVNIISGFLGSGKTTLIGNLLKNKPAAQNWAVIVNEFGQVGIDGALLADFAKHIYQVEGGCMCCSAAPGLQAALGRVFKNNPPDRIIIEPSGLGHPAGIIEVLTSGTNKLHLQLKAIITFVEASRLKDDRVLASDVFNQQVQMADVLVASKADTATPNQLNHFDQWTQALYPPKVATYYAKNGIIDPQILQLSATGSAPLNPHKHKHPTNQQTKTLTTVQLNPKYPLVYELMADDGLMVVSIIFAPDKLFDRNLLVKTLQPYSHLPRIKGVFKIGRNSRHVNGGYGNVNWSASSWHRDSRIEFFIDHAKSTAIKNTLINQLTQCYK